MDLARGSIVVAGILWLVVGIAHLFFHRVFNWRQVFAKVRPLDAKVFNTIHVALLLLGLVLAYVSLRFPDELASDRGLGGTLTPVLAAFWLWRLVWQLTYFRPRRLGLSGAWSWFHYGWIVLFAMLTAAYTVPLAARLVS